MTWVLKEPFWSIRRIVVVFTTAIALSGTLASAQSLEETLAGLHGNPPETLKRLDDKTIENGFGVKFIAVDRNNCVAQVKSELGISEFYFDNVIVEEIRKYWTDFGSGPALNYTLIGNPGDRVACHGGRDTCADRAVFDAVGEERNKTLNEAVAKLYPGLCRGTHRLDPTTKKRAEEREEKFEDVRRKGAEANKRAVETPEARNAFEALTTDDAIERDTNAKLLRDAYALYILLRRCHEARRGYLTIYVSDAELEDAREAMKQIEQRLKLQTNRELSIDRIWKASNRHADRWPVDADSCQSAYDSLKQQYRTVAPEENWMRKDF